MSTPHTLVLLRHAKSDWTGPEPDHERGLAKRGRRQAPVTGQWLATHAVPDLALVSSARRARLTWDLVAAELDPVPPVKIEPHLYGATLEGLMELIAGLDEKVGTALLVGHNPDLEDLVAELTGEYVRLPTSALAVLDLPRRWADLSEGATLRAAGRPGDDPTL